MLNRIFGLLLALACSAPAAELSFNFGDYPTGQTPPGFRSVLFGKGKPGEWKVIAEVVPPTIAPLSEKAPVVTTRAVLAQLSTEPVDERYPILLYDKEAFTDFTLTTKFKLVEGIFEQMAGIVFRAESETNFYIVRASGLGNNIRFYKVVNGQRGPLIGPELPIAKGVWHELQIECRGNQIFCRLNGNEAIPPLTDNTFASGKIGFWTKSDAVTYFADTKITYKPREPYAGKLVAAALEKYPRLVALKIFTRDESGEPRVLASKTATETGAAGGKAEKDAIRDGTISIGRDKGVISVIMPLRDRDGETIAAVRVTMSSFPGEIEQSALSRARPIVKNIQSKVQTLPELTD